MRYTRAMLAPEFILFSMFYVMVLIWTMLKVLVSFWIDFEPQPPRATTDSAEETKQFRRAA